MKSLIKNGDITLDGTAPRYIKEQEAFLKLEVIEGILEKYGIEDLRVLDEILQVHKFLIDHDYSTLPKKDFDLLFNKIKALEVIISKKVNINAFLKATGAKGKQREWQYNKTITDKDRWLTQNEFDLLKGVLLL